MYAAPVLSQPDKMTLATLPITQADHERKERMREAWRAYRGELQDPLKVASGQPNDNVKVNRCEPIVNKGVSFLFGQVLQIEATDEAQGSGPTPIQDFLNGLWGDNDDKMTRLAQIGINGAVCGSAFVKLIPPRPGMKYPRMVILDPMLIRIITAPDDCSLTIGYIIEYAGTPSYGTMSQGIQKRQVIARVDPNNDLSLLGEYDPEDTWTITNYMRQGPTGVWVQIGEVEEWPYPFPPIFHCQNLPNPNEAWGAPDLSPDLIGVNKVLNFILSNLSRIIKHHGHPLTYATGLSASQISTSVDDILCLPSEQSKINKLAPMENFAGLLSVVADLRSDMDEQSRVPAVALGRLADLPKGNISGVALQLLFQPLIEKTVQKRRLYGCFIREISKAALVLCDLISIEQYEYYDISLHWANLLPTDDLAAAQTSLLWKQMGVSSSTLLQTAGFDPEDEAAKSQAEAAQQVNNYSKGVGMPPTNPMQNPQVDTALQKSVGEA